MDSRSLPSGFDGLREADGDEAEYERLWALLQRVDAQRGAAYDVDREWDRLADRLDLDASENEEEAVPRDGASADRRASDRAAKSPASASGRRRRWGQAVGTAVLVVLLAVGGWWWTRPVSMQTAAGEQTVVTLPDGSTAELNGATSLSYADDFETWFGQAAPARRVRLDGEAFFSVEDRDRPFRIQTPNARVTVEGTSFNVRARRADGTPETEVVLASGRVQVEGTASPERPAVMLESPGQTSRVRGRTGPTSPQRIDLKYVAAWREGGFALSGAALPTVLRELEHRFGTTLRLNVPVATTDTMTLHYARDATLEDVLHDVCLIQNLSYRETSQGYELVREGS